MLARCLAGLGPCSPECCVHSDSESTMHCHFFHIQGSQVQESSHGNGGGTHSLATYFISVLVTMLCSLEVSVPEGRMLPPEVTAMITLHWKLR